MRFVPCLTAAVLTLAATGCLPESDREVVVYAALDREFSAPLLDAFGREHGTSVRAQYDVESTKTVQLVSRIVHERQRPACDVFWNNEILHTLRLDQMGLLASYRSPAAEDWPDRYRGSRDTWYGLAARARVLIVNTELVPDERRPSSILHLADPAWNGRAGIAKPIAGTTATHAAVLFATWGDERATAFFEKVRSQTRVLSGNKQVAAAVGRGQLAFGLTDTDDAIIEVEAGRPVEIIFPDQQEDGLGTLLIPNTICILKDCPHPAEAEALIDHLLSPAVESALARGPSAQQPVNPQVSVRARAFPDKRLRWMEADFDAAARQWDRVVQQMEALFAAP